jgi:succinate dehydrogenase / fumarate reductase iron-sulfur subunit
MIINKIPRLACKTQISSLGNEKPLDLRKVFGKLVSTIEWDPKNEVLIEPLPNFKIIKDLVVDLAPFWAKFETVKPWILGSSPHAGEMSADKATELEKAANCFLCALCVGTCPINAQYPEYVGPAALAQAWRYVEDPTDPLAATRLQLLKAKPEGALSCEYYYNCVKVCPREVAPAREIRLLRGKIGKP